MRAIGVDSKRMNPRGLASPRVRIRLGFGGTGWVRRLYHTPYLSIQPPSSRRCGKRKRTVTRGPLDGSQYKDQPCSQSVLMVACAKAPVSRVRPRRQSDGALNIGYLATFKALWRKSAIAVAGVSAVPVREYPMRKRKPVPEL